jgi:hypothetical protein
LSQSASRACQSGVDIMKSEALKSALNSWDFLFSFRAIGVLGTNGRDKKSAHPKMEIHARTSFFSITTSQMGSWIRRARPVDIEVYHSISHENFGCPMLDTLLTCYQHVIYLYVTNIKLTNPALCQTQFLSKSQITPSKTAFLDFIYISQL